MVRICGLFGVTRQAYYSHFWREQDTSIAERINGTIKNELLEHFRP